MRLKAGSSTSMTKATWNDLKKNPINFLEKGTYYIRKLKLKKGGLIEAIEGTSARGTEWRVSDPDIASQLEKFMIKERLNIKIKYVPFKSEEDD